MSDSPGMDPIRFEVMRCAFDAAADEMALALRRSAYSTNIKTRADFSCALYDADVRLVAQSFSQPIHLASMTRLVPAAVGRFGADRLGPGDALMFNNPHHGSMHLNDIAIIMPCHHGERRVGYAAAVAHHVDIGGVAPGGLSVSKDIYQEGVIIPAVRILRGGEIVEDVFNLVLANIRAPKQSAGDLRAQIAAVMLGRRRIGDIISRFGAETVGRFTDELIDHTRRWTRQAIADLPEGEVMAEGFFDDDGHTDQPIRLVVRAQVCDGRVLFDLTGSDPQRRSPMNANLTYAYSAAAYVVKCLIDPAIPANAGFYEQIDVTAPPGTVVNCTPPAGVVGGNEVAMRLADIGFRAFAEVLPNRVPACSKSVICSMGCGGIDPKNGQEYAFMETLAGGYGARPDRDGMDAVQTHVHNTENSAVEEAENNHPFLITRYELVPDSEGAGRFRGGLGLRRQWRFPDHEATLTVVSDGRKFPPWGLSGGGAARCARYVLDPDGRQVEMPSKFTRDLPAGSAFAIETPGGGGFGDPLGRDPQAVLDDVVNGKVSPQRAREVYGVVVDEQHRTVDGAATQTLRHQKTQQGGR